ncbi:MAG: hypothetical protein RMZ42_33955 [Nostoc sp. DedQUE05]|nr:hypothetical protein [Nostoc sp. DedQUE05]
MMSSVLLLEELNLLQLLTPGEKLRGSDERMQAFKAIAIQHRYLIKNYLNVTISEKLTPIAIAQKLLDKIDLRLSYVGRLGSRGKRECVYKFVPPDDQRDSIFSRWLNRELVSVTSNIDLTTPITDTTSLSTLPVIKDMEGQENSTHSWWQQVKSYAVRFMERLESGVEAVKQFLSTLTSDERWGVMVEFEEAQPQMFSQLVAVAPDWVQWMG